MFCIFYFHVFLTGTSKKEFSWNDQKWTSEQEKIFWLGIPDWGKLKEDFYLYPNNQNGDVLKENSKLGYSGFAKAYIHEAGIGYFRVVLEVKNGWVVTKKVWDEKGTKRILRKYQKGVLMGRYIDWYKNEQRKVDGVSLDGEKNGLWIEWYSNGQKREEGEWKDGKPYGIFEEWYPNGKKAREQVFKQGILKTALVWKPDGTLCKKSRVIEGEGLLLEYDLDGNLIGESEIMSGKRVVP